jgi:hypothetical protein
LRSPQSPSQLADAGGTGASPPEKHDTLVSRLQSQISTARLFYTTSPTSRSTPGFSRSEVILPPLASQTFIHALERLGVDTHFVPLGEADGAVVALADRLGAYILGQDSDFLILIGGPGAGRVKGYVPLDMIMWIESPHEGVSSAGTATQSRDEQSGGEWETRHNRRETHRQSHLLPPPSLTNPSLVITAIPPVALRQRLRLPASLLPLFASLCGNDYTPPSASEYLFEPGLRTTGRIEKVARVLREVLFNPHGGSPRNSHSASTSENAGDHAVELVKKVIKRLAVRDFSHDGALPELVEAIIEATFQYALPLGVECCELYPFCGELDPAGCQTSASRTDSAPVTPTASTSTSFHDQNQSQSQSQNVGTHGPKGLATREYAKAQRRGMLNSITHAWAYPDRMYLWTVLEDPSGASLKAGEGLRGVRQAAYLIAEEGFGGLRWADEHSEQGEQHEDAKPTQENGDQQATSERCNGDVLPQQREQERSQEAENPELIDLLGVHVGASAGGTSETLQGVGETKGSPASTPPRRSVTEYVRHSSRVSGFRLDLPPLPDRPIPLALESLDVSLAAYLAPLRSDIPAIRALPPHLHPLVAIVRLSVLDAASRADGKSGESAMWRRSDVEAVLKCGIGSYAQWTREWKGRKSHDQPPADPSGSSSSGGGVLFPLLTTRNAGIVAQISAAMTDSLYLAQSLLLLPEKRNTNIEKDPPRLTHLTPFVFFNGSTLHNVLNGRTPSPQTGFEWGEKEQGVWKECLEAVSSGVEETIVGWYNEKPRNEGKKGRSDSQEKEMEKERAKETGKVEREKTVRKRGGGQGGWRTRVGSTGAARSGRFDLLSGMPA